MNRSRVESMTNHARQLPTLGSVDDEASLTRPLSGWAVIALIIGLGCLLVPLSLSLLPISILAILLGLIVSIRLSRPDSASGQWMSLLCLALGLGSAVWSFTSASARSQYFSYHASGFAQEYLQLLSSGQLYNAMELRLPFSQRQTADVDLQAYYETFQGETQVTLGMLMVPGDDDEPEDPAKIRKTALERLKLDPVTVYALEHANARWNFVGIKNVVDDRKVTAVKVILQAEDDPKTHVIVDLMRHFSQADTTGSYAEWRVSQQELERAF